MTFIQEVWEQIWTGWTPIIMVGLFIAGMEMARRFASLDVSPLTTAIAFILGATLIPLSLPVFSVIKKR